MWRIISPSGETTGRMFFLWMKTGHVYHDLLQGQCQRYGFAVTGYCLMTNHVHLIGTPEREDSLAKAIGRTHFLYTRTSTACTAVVGTCGKTAFIRVPWMRTTPCRRSVTWS